MTEHALGEKADPESDNKIDFYAFSKLRESQRIANAEGSGQDVSFARCIDSLEMWHELAFLTDEAAFANTEVVKLILDLRDPKERVLRGLNPDDELLGKQISADWDTSLALPFFLQSRKFTWHFPFVRKHLMSKMAALHPNAHYKFNKEQYTSEEREFCCLTLTRYNDHDGLFALEMWPSDTLSGQRMAKFAQIVRDAVSSSLGEFCFHPMSPAQETECGPPMALAGIRVITSGDLFGKVKYQPLTLGRAVGRIRFVRSKLLERSGSRALVIKPWDLLVLDQLANDLPVCAALITSVVQPPLCHTALLCQNRGTPNLAIVGVFDENLDPESIRRHGLLRSLDRKWVTIEVTQQKYILKEVSKDFAIAAWLEKEEARLQQIPHCMKIEKEVSFAGIVDVRDSLPPIAKHAIGAKASQFSDLCSIKWPKKQLSYLHAPTGIVIPFHYYDSFMRAIDAPALIAKMTAVSKSATEDPDMFASTYLQVGVDLSDEDESSEDELNPADQLLHSRSVMSSSLLLSCDELSTPMAETVDSLCQELCRAIAQSDHDILEQLCDKIAPIFDRWMRDGLLERGVIFRSSTNCEDLPGFNGAGLYDSLPLSTHQVQDRTAIKNVIKQVWASMWKPRGFSEREVYGIDQESAAMALFVQPYAHDIRANGVVISLIPYKRDWTGVFINVQHGDSKVTDAGTGNPEQIAVYDESGGYPEIVARSSLNDGAPVISAEESRQIFYLVMDLHRRYGADKGLRHNAVDVEFVICGPERKILLLQCRPCTYNMS